MCEPNVEKKGLFIERVGGDCSVSFFASKSLPMGQVVLYSTRESKLYPRSRDDLQGDIRKWAYYDE